MTDDLPVNASSLPHKGETLDRNSDREALEEYEGVDGELHR